MTALILQKKVDSVAPQYWKELSDYIDYLLFRQYLSLSKQESSLSKNGKNTISGRQLGGFEKDFFIAKDFDETPECFKEYT